jgi:hypothetical protein
MFLRHKLQNEDSSFKILPQNRLSIGFENPGITINSKQDKTEWKSATAVMEKTQLDENSKDFNKQRAFLYGQNVYANPDSLLGKRTLGTKDVNKHFKNEMTIITSMFGSGVEVSSSDDPISFSILDDEKNLNKRTFVDDGLNTTVINAQIDNNSLGKFRQNLCKDLKEIDISSKNDTDKNDLLALMDSV